MCKYPRFMAAHDQTDYLLPRGRRLWHEICEKKHTDHLINCLKEQYKLTKDWNGNLYCGIAFQWNYAAQTLYISMPGYIKKQLLKYKHIMRRMQHCLCTHRSRKDTELKHNPPCYKMTHENSTRKKLNRCRQLWAAYFTTRGW